MPWIAELPDGREMEFPDTVKPEDVKQAYSNGGMERVQSIHQAGEWALEKLPAIAAVGKIYNYLGMAPNFEEGLRKGKAAMRGTLDAATSLMRGALGYFGPEKLQDEVKSLNAAMKIQSALDEKAGMGVERLAGELAGYVAEPVSGAVSAPLKGLQGIKAWLTQGTTQGAVFGFLQPDLETTEDRLVNAGKMAATGAGISTALGGLSKGVVAAGRKAQQAHLARLKDELEVNIAYNISKADNPVEGYLKGVKQTFKMKKMPTMQEANARLKAFAGVSKTLPRVPTTQEQANKLLVEKGDNPILYAARQKRGRGGDIRQGLRNVLMPFDSQLASISPTLYRMHQNAQFSKFALEGHLWTALKPLDDALKKANLKGRKAAIWNRAVAEGKDLVEVSKQLGHPELGEAYLQVKPTFDEMFAGWEKLGFKFGYRNNYFPLIVKNSDELTKHLPEHVLEKVRRGTFDGPLHAEEVTGRVAKLLYKRGGKSESSFMKQRHQYTKDLDVYEAAYSSPRAALHQWIRDQAELMGDAKLLKELGVPLKENELKFNKDQMVKMLQASLRKDNLTAKNVDDASELLYSYYTSKNRPVPKWVQRLKNSTYSLLLTDVRSALTQGKDIGFSLAKFGARDTLYGVAKALRMNPNKKVSRQYDLGIHDIVEEFSSTDATKKVLDFGMKLSGFSKMDTLGKETHVNAALKHWRRIAQKDPTTFVKTWGQTFGEDTAEVLSKLRDKRIPMTELAKDKQVLPIAWTELLDVQPITMTQMPVLYTKHPIMGRLLYTLNSFTVKQLDHLNKRVVAEAIAGNKKKAAKYAAGYLAAMTALGVPVDMAKDMVTNLLTGKDIDHSLGEYVTNNMLMALGANKFMLDSLLAGDIEKATSAVIFTPSQALQLGLDRLSEGLEHAPIGFIDMLPVVGRLWYDRLKVQDKQDAELMRQLGLQESDDDEFNTNFVE